MADAARNRSRRARSQCGSVEDVPAHAKLEETLASAVDQVQRATGFRTEHHRVDLVGRCRACA